MAQAVHDPTDRMPARREGLTAAAVDLYWLPLGAGACVVRISGRIYETLLALVQRRPRRDLYHTALVVVTEDVPFVIEVTPIQNSPGRDERGVVGEGPVGTKLAGRFRVFRYEIRRWRDGMIADVGDAVSSPVRLTTDAATARAVLDLVPLVPTPVWGRDELRTGEMWNSNSVTAWLLVRAGLEPEAGEPPDGGRAPGWSAGVVVARQGGDPFSLLGFAGMRSI